MYEMKSFFFDAIKPFELFKAIPRLCAANRIVLNENAIISYDTPNDGFLLYHFTK